ncbi:helix-turn-helix transcriptional regulator [Burkholderia metallica]|uniref:helix-turn-helix transcriptional regulator n=1 Tax=Burkholderia metallica TaxID=488729 RepID=UPI000D1B3721|nr:AlpA family phage regulatory protein [Burkholderia metallica]
MSTTTERLLRLPTVIGMVGLGKTTIYDMMKQGSFPKPRRVRNLSLWAETEVQAWIRSIMSHKMPPNSKSVSRPDPPVGI